MAEASPLARSPISPAPPVAVQNGWEVSARRTGAELRLADCTPLAKVLVLATTEGDLGVRFGRAARDERVRRSQGAWERSRMRDW